MSRACPRSCICTRDGHAVPFVCARLYAQSPCNRANRYTWTLGCRALRHGDWVILLFFVIDGVPMKSKMCVLAGVVLLQGAWFAPALAQERIYRCGNEYTNNPEQARLKNCRPLEGGNLTVVQGTRPAQAAAPSSDAATPAQVAAPQRGGRSVSAAADAPRVSGTSPATQRARESDARAILEAELRRAEGALAQARQAFSGGQPEKQGPEFRNHQLYLDRVAQLQATVQRAEADVNSIKRELSRFTSPSQ